MNLNICNCWIIYEKNVLRHGAVFTLLLGKGDFYPIKRRKYLGDAKEEAKSRMMKMARCLTCVTEELRTRYGYTSRGLNASEFSKEL